MKMHSLEVKKLILNECLKNRNVPNNSLVKKYNVQRKTVGLIIKSWSESRRLERKSRNRERGLSSLKLDQKVIRGINANPEYFFPDVERKLVLLSRQSKTSKREIAARHTGN